jgi:hypothetical protein
VASQVRGFPQQPEGVVPAIESVLAQGKVEGDAANPSFNLVDGDTVWVGAE